MAAKWQRIAVTIPKDLTEAEQDSIADLYIEAIKQRAEKGIDKDGKSFPAYSESYMKSLDFKIGGKSKNVNLTLSGDMLASIQLLRKDNGKLVIGFEKGSDENAKADGNIRGTYGQSSPSSKKARDFLGLPDAELLSLLEEFDSEELRERTQRFKTVYY